MATSAKDFLTGGAKRFPTTIAWGDRPVGSSVGGFILEDPVVVEQTDMETKQVRYFEPDKETGERLPMMQMMLIVQSDDANPATEDDGKRTLAIRGGFKYESSKKALVEELQRNGLEMTRIGDYVKMTRIENRKGAGFQGRTHQFACDYTKVEDFDDELKALAAKLLGGGDADEAQAEPVKKAVGRPKKAAAATVNSAWEE